MKQPTTNLAFPHAWRAEVLTTPPLIAPARQFTYPRPVPGEEDALARGALQLLIHPPKNPESEPTVRVPHSSAASSSMSGMDRENDGVAHPYAGDSTHTGGEKNDRVPHSSAASSSMSGMNTSPFLATCALGFTDPSMPTGIFSCPNPRELCAVAGGYAYIIDTAAPERSTHIPLRPVVEILPLPDHALLLFTGFHSILAWGANGLAWQTARLSWEGLRLTGVRTGAEEAPNGAPHDAAPGTPYLHGLGWNMHTDKEVEFAIDLRTGAHTGGGY